jgi:hypothetical protein
MAVQKYNLDDIEVILGPKKFPMSLCKLCSRIQGSIRIRVGFDPNARLFGGYFNVHRKRMASAGRMRAEA